MDEQTQSEKVFYDSNNVKVTSSRFISGSKTYAMRNISSVSVGVIEAKRAFPIILLIVGILFLIPDGTRYFGAILAGIGILLLISAKDNYSVKISSNSGEVNGYVSTNKGDVEDMVDAINNAIISTGAEQSKKPEPPAGDDTISKLEKLARLKETGILNEVEFEAEKARILKA